VVGAAWWATTKIVAGVGDLVQRTGDGRTSQVLSCWTIGSLGNTMCGLHRAREDEERRYLSSASKPRSMACQWFGLKTTGMVCQWFDLKTTRIVCQWFDLKTTRMVC
jgi:hypothetical protein